MRLLYLATFNKRVFCEETRIHDTMTIIYRGQAILALVLLASVPAGMVEANLLLNPSFELGSSSPSNWNMWGDGTFTWQTGGARTGSKCMSLGDESGSDFALMYQRASGSAGNSYEVRAWAKRSSGSNSGTVKLEFHDSGAGEIEQHHLNFAPEADWTEYTITKTAPAGTGLVTATIVGGDGGMVLFDDISLMQVETPEPIDPVFDVSNISHTFLGFGAQIWGYGNGASYPNLETYRQQALEELNIKYVRIENHNESATWPAMQRTRAMTDALGIKWVYMSWIAWCCMDENNMLNDVPAYATWWKNHVADLYSHGIPVEYIELMNEPDSWGQWSTGITYSDYNSLVKDLRTKLDNAGYSNVGIVGAGPANISVCDDYIYALDTAGVAAMAAWSTHSWGSPDGLESESRALAYLKIPGDTVDPILPKFVTEYATHQTTFDGITTDPGDDYGIWDETEVFFYYATMNRHPYAVQVYENTLGLLNGGTQVPFIWQAIDEPTEVNPPGFSGSKRKAWGLLDLWGDPKPVYGALKTLYPKIPVGADVLVPPDQSVNPLYAGAFVYNNKIIVGVANNESFEYSTTIYLTNAPDNLEIVEAVAFEQIYWGDPADGDPDIGHEVNKTLSLVPGAAGQYGVEVTLPSDSTLTIVMCARWQADIDGDCDVDIEDLRDFVGLWLTDANDADFDDSGTVDGIDFGTVTKDWQQGIN